MIKQLLTLALLISTFSGIAQNELKKNWYKGNILYQNGEFSDALLYFQKAVDNSPLNFKANFNLGNTFFRTEDYEKATAQFEKIAQIAPSKLDQSWVYHNLGNAHLLNNKINEAIDAYKEALRLNPKDEETRYNLAYAQLLKKQQEEQNQKNQDKNNEEQDQSDQQQDKNNENKNDAGEDGKNTKDDQGNKPDEKDEGDGKDENKDGQGDQKDQDNQPSQENKYQPISKEQAKRILDAASRKEKQIQAELDKDKKVGEGKSGKIDW